MDFFIKQVRAEHNAFPSSKKENELTYTEAPVIQERVKQLALKQKYQAMEINGVLTIKFK